VALVIDIELLTGRYDAAGAGDRDVAEWPPHPARVFCALVASCRGDDDRGALRWLESLPAPVVQASGAVLSESRRGYVVTNKTDGSGRSQFHPGRSHQLRIRQSAVPASATVRMVWDDTDTDPAALATLDDLARRVPYLGRSTGLAALRCRALTASDASDTEGLVCFEPASEWAGAQQLRVPYRGYLDDLTTLHAEGRPPWEASRTASYRRVTLDGGGERRPVGLLPSVYTDVLVLRFAGARPDGRLTARFTAALRRAVMARTPDPLPAVLHGHGVPGRPHVVFMGLPNVGHPHADGRLLGLAVAIPDLPETERRMLVRTLLRDMARHGEASEQRRVLELHVPDIGLVDLVYEPGMVRPWATQPERWRRGSRSWVSVTPVVLDRFPKDGDLEREVARSAEVVGLPSPREVVVSPAPLVQGGIRLRPGDLPARARGRIFRHVRLTFDRPVSGPVLIGAGRYLGVGLFMPVDALAPGSAGMAS
jgi:CRISPR-associated protein Csb2